MKPRNLVCAALLAASGTAVAANAPVPERHAPAASCFPATVDGLETVTYTEDQLTRLKAYRNSTAAGYNAPARGTAITLFVYDRAADADDHREVDTAIREVLSVHRGAEMAMGGEGKVPLAGVDTPAQGGLFLWTEANTDYGSFLWVIPRTHHYLKLRVTYVRPPGDDAAVAAMRFAMESLMSVARNTCDPG